MHLINVGSAAEARSECLAASTVDAYLAAGCMLVGYLRTEDVDTRAMSWQYAEADRAQFIADADALTGLLLSADGHTLIEVSTFVGKPTVRLRSVLADGRLIATRTRWAGVPALNPSTAPGGHPSSLEQQMRIGHAPSRGRAVYISTQEQPAELLAEHTHHVRALAGSVPARHYTQSTALHAANRILTASMEHSFQVIDKAARYRPIVFGAFCALLIGFLAVAVVLRSYAVGCIVSLLGAWALNGWLQGFSLRAASRIAALRPPTFPGVPEV